MNLHDPNGDEANTLSNAPEPGDDATMPIGVGEPGGEAGFDAGSSGAAPKKMKTGPLLLVLVVACASVGLFSMRFLARVSAAAGMNAGVEKTVEDFLKALTGGAGLDELTAQLVLPDGETIGALNDDYTEKQVALADVQKNPFIIFNTDVETGPVAEDDGSRSMREWERQRTQRRQAIEAAAARLRLKTVMMGVDPIAHLSGRLVHVGDEFEIDEDEIEFEVIGIGRDWLTILAADESLDLEVEVTLRMGEN